MCFAKWLHAQSYAFLLNSPGDARNKIAPITVIAKVIANSGTYYSLRYYECHGIMSSTIQQNNAMVQK